MQKTERRAVRVRRKAALESPRVVRVREKMSQRRRKPNKRIKRAVKMTELPETRRKSLAVMMMTTTTAMRKCRMKAEAKQRKAAVRKKRTKTEGAEAAAPVAVRLEATDLRKQTRSKAEVSRALPPAMAAIATEYRSCSVPSFVNICYYTFSSIKVFRQF